jgi:uncharacterized protein YecE (DUF72 family)
MIHIYTGTSGFAHKEWKGKFYPDNISPKDMLRFYAEHLSTVEINNTFYHMPKESVLTSWAKQVPSDFVFALKAPQVITHIRRLRNVNEPTDYLFKSLSVLGRKLGPILFQFPKSFGSDLPALEDFLTLIPDTAACAFEFRSASWLDAGIPDLLRGKGCSMCIADTDENPVQEMISTANWGYLRLRRSDYTDADLIQWVERILSQKWERAFVYFKHEDEAKGSDMAVRFQKLIASRLDKEKTKRGRMRKAG